VGFKSLCYLENTLINGTTDLVKW